jgi:hypothetical protein
MQFLTEARKGNEGRVSRKLPGFASFVRFCSFLPGAFSAAGFRPAPANL